MNFNIFTVEEENLICIFDIYSRSALINAINIALSEFDEPELRGIAENILLKLNAMTDTEFSAFIFSPVYFNDDDEQEV